MKFTKADLEKANARLMMCPFYPTDPMAQAAVMDLLRRMCPSKEALEWLVTTVVNRVGKWPGPAELRGLLCWKFPPADREEGVCSIPGFTWMDGEERTLNEHLQLKADGYSGEAPKLIKAAEPKRLGGA